MQRRHLLRQAAAAPLAAALAPWTATAAEPAAPSAAALAEDIQLVGEVLRSLHPGLLRYTTAAAVDERLARLQRDFAAAPDLRQRYLLLSAFLATLRCGHSYANFFNQRPPVQAALFTSARTRLPFTFRWIDGEMAVTGSQSDALALAPGTVVESVNGVAAAELLRTLMPYARADGGNDAKRVSLLSVRGRHRLEFFDVFHGLVYGEPPGGVHRLALRSLDGRRRTVEAPALSADERHRPLVTAPTAPASGATDAAIPWRWVMDADGIATLTMPGWALYNSRWDWKAWLDARLDSLDGARGLIVDLRDNEGGLDCGDAIVARAIRADSVLAARRLVRYRRVPAHLNTFLDTWDERFREWPADTTAVDDRFFALAGDAGAVVRPQGPPLKTPIAVLTSAENSSATFAFAQRCRQAGIATLVGEPTGGNRRGINGGAFFFVRLPASGLEFDLPLIGYFPDTPQPDAGLLPDVAVPTRLADLAQGADPQMARARALWMR